MEKKKRKDFTFVSNELLRPSQLSVRARYLLIVLLMYCGQDDYCFPSQETLAKTLGFTDKYVRGILTELIENGLVSKKRRGFNRSNTYKVASSFIREFDRNTSSYHLGSKFPIHQGNNVPTKNTYLKGKNKRSIKGLEDMRSLVESRFRDLKSSK